MNTSFTAGALAALLFLTQPAHAQQVMTRTDSLLSNVLAASDAPALRQMLQEKDAHRLQIIYTRIDRDRHNIPHCHNYYFNFSPELYFYPASTVKLPTVAVAMEKMRTLASKNIDLFTRLSVDSSYAGQQVVTVDSTAKNGFPTLAHYIKKTLVVSDNDAYNKIYTFDGQQRLNQRLWEMGYPEVRIVRRFEKLNEDGNRHTAAIRFLNEKGALIYTQPPAYNTDSIAFDRPAKIGTGYFNASDLLVNEPMDFTRSNRISLLTLQQVLQSLLFPSSVPQRQRFRLRDADYDYLKFCLSVLPHELKYPAYDTAEFYDTYAKFLFNDARKTMPDGVRVFNKIGIASGFMTDVAYVADFNRRVEFMLTATVYVNDDGVFNDDKYGYDKEGFPFFYELGQCIYNYELHRPRPVKPDLSAFQIDYQHSPFR